LPPEVSNNRYCALMILTRNDILSYRAISRKLTAGNVGKSAKVIDSMFLSQPPLTALEATIWEERDETKDYVGRTSEIEDSIVHGRRAESGEVMGLTIGELHRRVGEMFERYGDLSAIKLTTL
jgi:hypothetical protein